MSDSKRASKEGITAPVKAEPEFSIPALRKDCLNLFGVTSSTFDGAMSGREGAFTIASAKNIIEAWKKEVAR